VIDFTHVAVAAPTRLGWHRADGGQHDAELIGPIQLLVGDELALTARPYDGDRPLLGTAASAWDLDDPAIATLLASGDPAARRLVARAPGTAEVTLESFGFATTLAVEVLP
jgi:hypothetical protein